MALETGFRKTEIVNLRVSDIDWNTNTLRFRRKGTGTKIATLPIMKNVKDSLRQAYDVAVANNSEYIFFSPVNKGKPITEMSITKLFSKCQEKAGLSHKEVSPHSLRSTAITKIAQEKGIMVAKEVASHVSIQTTMRYVRGLDLVSALDGM